MKRLSTWRLGSVLLSFEFSPRRRLMGNQRGIGQPRLTRPDPDETVALLHRKAANGRKALHPLASDIQTMIYGDPMNFELGLFGDYSIRIDESVKAVERMNAILGDVMVGGNLIVKDGFCGGHRAQERRLTHEHFSGRGQILLPGGW